jgi:chemotaxis protein histidine kinase CheA/ActR/RegA family two-component response regulator
LADRLATLIECWQAPRDAERPIASPELEDFRAGLNAIASETEGEGEIQDSPAPALRRIALLTEIWECLNCEPDQAEAAAEVRAFCLGALDQLAGDRQSPLMSVNGAIGEEILRQSNERWGDYLGSLDPSCDMHPVAENWKSFEDSDLIADDAPPELDQATLLRLLQGAGPTAAGAPSRENRTQAPISHETLCPSSAGEGRFPPLQEPSTQIITPLSAGREVAGSAEPPEEPRLQIPPLPATLELDDELREAFLADAIDLFERIEKSVVALGTRHPDQENIRELCRDFHTLKGAAGSVGLSEVANLVHELEERLRQSGGQVSPGLNDLLHQVVNYLEGLIGWLRRRGGTTSQPGTAQQADVMQTLMPVEGRTAAQPAVPPVAREAPIAPRALDRVAPVSCPAPVQSSVPSPDSPPEGPIRVPAARFDELTDLASELIVQGRFWRAQAETMKKFASSVQDCRNRLLASLDRLQGVGLWELSQHPASSADQGQDCAVQLRRIEEHVDDLAILAASANGVAAPMADRGDALVRLSRRIWDSFQSLRIVPIQGLFQRLARVVHEAAKVEGRQVDVVMNGEETGADRAVQDKAFEPLLHAVRNAVAHGIETPSDRVRVGKPASGRVTLEARREGNALVIVVEDDGKGIDEASVTSKARQLGWLGPEEVPSSERLHGFLFRPGFSTRSQANAISGRGVGMDVVAREVEHLRGTLDLASQANQGTQLTIRLPTRLALETALIVRVAGLPLAIPASLVEHAQLFEPSPSNAFPEVLEPTSVDRSSIEPKAIYLDRSIPVVFAREMLGMRHPSSLSWPKLVIVRTGGQLIGLVVDAIERAEELVIKPLGALLAGHPLVSGTSTSVSGEIISVLHGSGLERWLNDRMASGACSALPAQAPALVAAEERRNVLVVDDSISVRRGLARQLSGLGLNVQEVSNALEALGRLREGHYGLVLTDLEMPKLDGFALLAELKRSTRLATIPVIVASTRCDPETRRRVRELGAQALLAKPVDPAELARVVDLLLCPATGQRPPNQSELDRDGSTTCSHH